MTLDQSMKSLGNHQFADAAAALAGHIPDTTASREAIRNAAVAMVLTHHPESGLSALFIQRAEHPDDPWSGHTFQSLPGQMG